MNNRNPWLQNLFGPQKKTKQSTPKLITDPELNSLIDNNNSFIANQWGYTDPFNLKAIPSAPVGEAPIQIEQSSIPSVMGSSIGPGNGNIVPETKKIDKDALNQYVKTGTEAINSFSKMKWYKKGGFWSTLKDTGLALVDTALGSVGMHDVINDRAYDTDTMRNIGNIGSRIGQFGTQIAATAIGGPAAGAAVSAGQNAMQSTFNNDLVEKQNLLTQQVERDNTMNYGRQTPLPFKMGGQYNIQDNDFVEFHGNKHEEGGIPLGKGAEVEGGEAKYNLEDGSSYIFSDFLGYKSTSNNKKAKGKTFAKEAIEINDRFNIRPYDAMSERANNRALAMLTNEQELVKTALDTKDAKREQKKMFRLGGEDPQQNFVQPLTGEVGKAHASLLPGNIYTKDGKYYNGEGIEITDPEAVKSFANDKSIIPYPTGVTTTATTTAAPTQVTQTSIVPTEPAQTVVTTPTETQDMSKWNDWWSGKKVGQGLDNSELAIIAPMRKFFNDKLGLGISSGEMNAPRYGNKTAKMFEQLKSNPALYEEFVKQYPQAKQYFYTSNNPQQSTTTSTQPPSTQPAPSGAVSETTIGKVPDQTSLLLNGIVNGSKGKSFVGDPIQTSINPFAYAPGYVSDYYNLYRGLKGPDQVQKYMYNPEYVNTRAQEVLLENAANNAYGTVRANLPRSSQAAYLASIGSAYSGIADNLGKQQAQVRQQRDLQNNQLANQAQTINMQSQMQADQTRQQELDAARSWTSQGLASVANRTSQWMADKNANDTQNFMLKNMLASKDFQFTDKGIEQSVDLSVKQYMAQGYSYDEAKVKANQEAIDRANAYIAYVKTLTGTNAGINASLAKASTGVKSENK